ncbi:MAG TPA: hypothetical protein DCZ76_09485 [Treponema sp.]|nr:hypothetical protein [Treponema sp.]
MEGGLAVCGDLFVRIAASSAAMTTCVVGVFLRHTPDWKGAGRVAVGNGAGAEPWKAGDAGHGRSD